MKNEEPYVEEWIEYYTKLGCEVIIYNNDSEGNLADIATENGAIVHSIHGSKRQNDAYNDAIKKYYNTYKYMMFFDGDEFLVSPSILSGEKLETIIDRYFIGHSHVAGIGVNWLIFGSSGHRNKPKGEVIDNFLFCAKDDYEWNQLIKTIVNPRKIIGFVGPHLPIPLLGNKIYDLDGKEIKNPRIKLPSNKELRLHHYFTKSEDEFKKRIKRGMADRNARRSMEEFYERDKNEVYNDTALKIKKCK